MRLKLNSIILHNFKSYKGTHTISNIDSSFTAIVGPNGSGKSNVIDSILFVLGFRAKKMRHSQVTDLIYNDGKREKECFVELIFNKFKIKRSIFLNKTTKYFINDKDSSSGEVVKLMMDEGVDMEHNRFLILQGEIESIAMMKPKEGLLEFLEDIIGTNKYLEEIEVVQEEIKDLDTTKTNLKSSLAFVQKDFKHAEELKLKNEKELTDKLDFYSTKEEINQMENYLLQKTMKEKEEEKDKLNQEIENLRNTHEETRKIFNTFEKKYQKVKKELNQKEGAFLTSKREYKKVERHNENQKETQNRLEKKIKSLKQEIRTIESSNELKEKEKEIYLNELKENENELKEVYKSIEKNNKLLAKEEKKAPKGDFKLLKETEGKLIALLENKSKIGQKTSKISAEIKFKSANLDKLNDESDKLKAKINSLDLELDQNKVGDSKENIQKRVSEVERDISATQKELQKRKNRFAEANQKKESDLREQEAMKHLSTIKGVIGRLEDIGRINLKYDVAYRMACSKLNNIVVDTSSTADKCMEIIKKKNIPRTTLIVLEKIKNVPNLEKLSSPYLFELVECEEVYRKCFYFALTDTLVCDDLKEGEKLAFGTQRRRVVTLDGKVIEKSGVMTGGKVTERVKSYDEIEKSLEKMEKFKVELFDKLKICEELSKLKMYKSDLRVFEQNRDKLNSELKILKDKLSGFKLEDLEGVILSIKSKLEEIKNRVENNLEGVVREIQTELKIANDKIEILEKRNQEIKIYLAQSSFESLEEKEKELLKTDEQIKKIKFNDFKELKDNYEALEEEYNKLLSNFKEVQEEMNESKRKMGDNYHNEIDLKNKFEDLEEKLGELKNKFEFNKQEIVKIKREEKELLNLIKKIDENFTKEESLFDGTNFNSQDIKDFIKKQKKRLENLSGYKEIDFKVFEEFLSIKKVLEKTQEDYERASERYKEKRGALETLRTKRYDEFMKGFTEVSKHLKGIYKALTYGGNAELELVDYLDPFSEGVILAVMPPKKCWKNVNNLSGGEKTLSSLALIFALHKYKPSPFYVMDEIDAALDYRNVSIISNYIREMTKNSQFLIISLRNDMFEMANNVLGVYKTGNISKFLMINVREISKMVGK